MPAPSPDAFRRSVDSGLLLPPELSRERQVWTKAEWRLLERCTRMLESHDLRLQLQCTHDTCRQVPLVPSRLPGGDFQLACPHATRVMTKAF